jgi:hypothetical protein
MQSRLMVLRIIWAALLMGEVMFMAVTLAIGGGGPPADPRMPQIMLYVAIIMLASMVPIAYVIRSFIYRGGRREDGTVSAQAYATGNILFWAMCEGVAFCAITGAFLNGGRGPHLFVACIAIAVQVLNFPTGAVLDEEER